MHAGGRRVLVLLVVAVLGIVGGVATALVTANDPAPRSGSPQSSTPNSAPNSAPGSGTPRRTRKAPDPLNLDVPRVNLRCTGEGILVVGHGDHRSALAAVVADHAREGVRYLRVADSCPTLYAGEFTPVPVPEYAAYLGPYKSLAEACRDRMTLSHKGDNVTRLRSGNDIFVKCVCELPASAFPVLGPGRAASAEDGIWVRHLQLLLVDFDRLPDEAVTGRFDDRTTSAVAEIQAATALAPADGVVNPPTWTLLRDRLCGTYEY
jgi:peptidoglycan hydrolase-like protein with peptidoglycan-binding domain